MLMIDQATEELIPLTKAARIVNPSRPPNVSTVWRWALSGLAGGIRLESIKVGGIRFTSREAVARFLRRLNEPGTLPPESPSAAAIKAGEELARLGV